MQLGNSNPPKGSYDWYLENQKTQEPTTKNTLPKDETKWKTFEFIQTLEDCIQKQDSVKLPEVPKTIWPGNQGKI